ncbi:MAG: flagellar basal body protein [Proteobacteria bacterium]|nr:flagellar basal body protein [Pseudomonadota bacterium]
MIPATQSALSALQAFGTKLHSNANNIANVSSEGFKKTRVTLANQEPQGAKSSVEKIDTPGAMSYEQTSGGLQFTELSNVDLGQELPESTTTVRFYQANLKTLQVADEMMGSLLKLKA